MKTAKFIKSVIESILSAIALLILAAVLASQAKATECRSVIPKKAFLASLGFKTQPKGTIVDHICPLAIGGLDIIGNMQLQTIKEAREKDKWERDSKFRSLLCTSENSLPIRTVYNCK